MSQPLEGVGAVSLRVHLLDVGQAEYGDSLLIQFDDASVMIDGAHPGDQTGKGTHRGIPDQLGSLLGQPGPTYTVDLLIVTHSHLDHIGCLPYLVAHDQLRAEWALVADPGFGWGRPDDGAPDPVSLVDAPTRHVLAALREEVPTHVAEDAVVSQLISDAADLQSRYTEMLTALQTNGTTVVRYGRDGHDDLAHAFESIGLTIVGPGIDHLQACAEVISGATDSLLQHADGMFNGDDAATPAGVYRRMLSQPGLADSAEQRPGPAINLQSIVTSFEQAGTKILFAGDMQWVDQQVNNQTIQDSVRSLRQSIQKGGPYSFAKLSHHGSDNGFDEQVFQELGATNLFGICAGEQSTAHPNPSVLTLLDQHRQTITWARTDHNRLSTFTFEDGIPTTDVERGTVNDPVPNAVDEAVAPMGGTAPTGGAVTSPPAERAEGNVVEVVTRIPRLPTRVTVAVDVQPEEPGPAPAPRGVADAAGIQLAGGRDLPALLFATNRKALATNVGRDESDAILQALSAKGILLVDDVPSELDASAEAVEAVREQLRAHPDVKGVVLVGGYDVVASRIVDCLPAELRAAVTDNSDADDFVVWSDDPFGDRDGDEMPELPVSRIPDAKSAALVRTALQANDNRRATARAGVRNKVREFADGIYALLPAPRDLLQSAPSTFDQNPGFVLDADLVYLMLHGDFDDSSRYWGEAPPEYPVAVGLSNVPSPAGRIVFAGCCWGALTVDKRAARADPAISLAPKTTTASLALSFLANGATAYVGCTGSHYSPREAPYGSFGGPMHQAFWTNVVGGMAPAEALFEAKKTFGLGIPHGQTSPQSQAIEYKIFREFTCLGLGW